jgi:hypothetical protein
VNIEGPATVLDNMRTTLVGVLSFGREVVAPPLNGYEYPVISARVSAVKDWILQNTDAAEWQCK